MVLVFIFVLNRVVPGSFMPEEDQGYFKVELELPEGATLERYTPGDGSGGRISESSSCSRLCTECDRFQSPGRNQPGPLRTDGDSEIVGKA